MHIDHTDATSFFLTSFPVWIATLVLALAFATAAFTVPKFAARLTGIILAVCFIASAAAIALINSHVQRESERISLQAEAQHLYGVNLTEDQARDLVADGGFAVTNRELGSTYLRTGEGFEKLTLLHVGDQYALVNGGGQKELPHVR